MMDDILKAFRVETAELLNMITDELLRYESGEEGAVNELFRAFHTIKGSCSIVGMERGEGFAHSVETRLDRIRSEEHTSELQSH